MAPVIRTEQSIKHNNGIIVSKITGKISNEDLFQ
jgi:hypothetical protein